MDVQMLRFQFDEKKGGRGARLYSLERAWRDAPANGPIADNPNRETVLQDAREFAAYGVL
jgi:hypothetical protein